MRPSSEAARSGEAEASEDRGVAHSRPGSMLTYYAQGAVTGAGNAVDTAGPEGGGGQGGADAGGAPCTWTWPGGQVGREWAVLPFPSPGDP